MNHPTSDHDTHRLRWRIVRLYGGLIAVNLLLWGLTLLVSTSFSYVLGIALLAYSFGLRHGVDADHIAAIDNVTRKLVQDGKRPIGVGLFFSLGHSTIVLVLSVVVAVTASFVRRTLPEMQNVGGLIGTSVSALFLYAIGIINLLVLLDIVRVFRRVTRGEPYEEESVDRMLGERGMLNRFFGPAVRGIDASWKMYPLGVLFGLGFDTATEIALLGISATTMQHSMPPAMVLLFPLLFAAGMTLVDTTDSILMLGAYGWARVKPVRKLYYNMNITMISVLVALVVGTIEVMQILAERFGLQGVVWQAAESLDFERIGYLMIAVFLLSWLVSTAVYRLRGYDTLDLASAPETTASARPS
ncbi:MAG: HoxN/HupN/NixA family nickel/cobalt transporter [Thermomicrobiales bacterium]